MTRYIWHNDQWVPRSAFARRPNVGPYIITDTMQPALHPVTGQTFDSKSAFRAVTKEHGLVELGNDAPLSLAAPEQPSVKQDVIEAYQMVEQGYTPPPLETAEPGTRIYT
jgi:hypothetical protein